MTQESTSSLTRKLSRGLVVLAASTLLSLLATDNIELILFLKMTAVTYVSYNLLGFIASFPLLAVDPRPITDPGKLYTSTLVFAGSMFAAYVFGLYGFSVHRTFWLVAFGVVNIAAFWTVWTIGTAAGLCPKIEGFLPTRCTVGRR